MNEVITTPLPPSQKGLGGASREDFCHCTKAHYLVGAPPPVACAKQNSRLHGLVWWPTTCAAAQLEASLDASTLRSDEAGLHHSPTLTPEVARYLLAACNTFLPMEATSMTLSETEIKEQEERNAITELLFFASTGNVARMQTLIAFRGVAVSICNPPVQKPQRPSLHGHCTDHFSTRWTRHLKWHVPLLCMAGFLARLTCIPSFAGKIAFLLRLRSPHPLVSPLQLMLWPPCNCTAPAPPHGVMATAHLLMPVGLMMPCCMQAPGRSRRQDQSSILAP